MTIRALEGEENGRKFELSFCSEEPYLRWFGPEILDCSEAAVDLTRLNSIGCVLFNHDRDEVVAKILRAWVDGGRGYAEIEFDSDEESEKIYQKVASGTLKGVSIGYTVSNWEEVAAGAKSADGKFTGPCSIARNWAPLEISIVSVPADPTVGVGREFEPSQEEPEKKPGHADDLRARQLQINLNSL
jgi:phage head maturation protease